MDEELKKLFEENLKLSRETNKIAKMLRRQLIWGRVQFFIKVAVVIGIIYAGVTYIPPFIDKQLAPYRALLNLPNQIQRSTEGVRNIPLLQQFLQNGGMNQLPKTPVK